MRTFFKKTIVLLTLKLLFAANGHFLQAAQPDWWDEYSIVDGTPRQDNAVATIGQAKHMVQKAYQYLEAELASSGGAGVEVTALYNSYCVTAPANPDDDLQPLTVGKLKYFAKPFYDRLNSAEVAFDTRALNPASTGIYPWTSDQSDDDDLAPATLSQLKFAFSFDLSEWTRQYTDTDDDFVDSLHEAYFGFSDNDDNDVITNTANNTLNGSSSGDQLYGGIGNDVKFGGAGNDIYYWYLGDGNDFASDSSGENFLQFGEGVTPEIISYERGNASSNNYLDNWVQDSNGADLKIRIQHPINSNLSGSFIIDSWSSYLNHWSIRFHNGTIVDGERLFTSINDVIWGTELSETLDGLSGNDVMYGRDGNDRLIGGTGDDRAYGENGDDVYVWSYGDGNDYFYDTNGANELRFGTGIGFSNLSFERGNVSSSNYISAWSEVSNGSDLKIIITHPTDTALSGSIVIDGWTSYSGQWNVYFEDTFYENGRRFGTALSNTLYGRDNTDDSLSGLEGNDTLYGYSGNDSLDGNSGGDTLHGGTGDDRMIGGTGNDEVYGESDNDVYIWNYGDGDDFFYDYNGANELQFGSGIDFSNLTFERGNVSSSNYISDWSEVSNGSDLKIIITHPTDTALSGSIVIDVWTSYSGQWNLYFEDIFYENGRRFGTALSDTLYGRDNTDDSLSGLEGNDTLYGYSGNDSLNGNSGNDTLYGGAGEDRLMGGTGNDLVYGQNDDDVYVWNYGDGNDYFYDYNGANELQFGSDIAFSNLTFERGNVSSSNYISDWSEVSNGADLKIIITHPTDAALSGSIVIYAWTSYKTLWNLYFEGQFYSNGNVLATHMNDTITTGSGDDVVLGLGGDDVLSSGYGNDQFIGGTGNDIVNGGHGFDSFFWNFGDGDDFYYGSYWLGYYKTLRFGPGITSSMVTIENDSVSSSNYLTAWLDDPSGSDRRFIITHPSSSELSGSVVINSWTSYGGYWRVEFEDGEVWDAVLYPDPVNVIGTASNDTINGDNGADDLQGGLGNDSIHGGSGEDTLSGDEGFDFINTGYGSDVVFWNLGDQHDFVQGLYFTNEQKILKLGSGITPDMLSFEKGNASSADFIASQLSAWNTSVSGSDLRVIITHPSDSGLSGSIIIDSWNSYRDYWLIELSEDGTLYQGNYTTTAGDDTISGTSANDSYRGSGGDDTLNGNLGDDSLFGDQGNDTLNGNSGDDSLYGGADNDLVYGSSGDDAYYWSFGDGHDYFSDSQGLNTLVLGTGITEELWQVEKGDNVSASNYISGWSVNLDGPDLRISISHPTDSTLSGSIVIESWASYADYWQIQFPAGYIIPGTLLGTDGNDALTGSGESDLMYGGLSEDYCRGFDGDDVYVYHLGDGFDVWEDSQGLNTIRFGEGITSEMLTFRLYNITTTSVSEIPVLPPEKLEDLGIVIESNGVQVGFIVIGNWIYNTMNWRVEFTALDPNTGLVYPAIERTEIRDELLFWDADLDDDTIPDWWELLYGLDASLDNRTTDYDDDGLLDADEFSTGTNPTNPDSDGDGLTDGQEVQITGTNPLVHDLDELDTDLNLDGLDDSIGVQLGIRIDQLDSDGDGVSNEDERFKGTNLHNPDTDGDGENDAIDPFPLEALLGSSDFVNDPNDLSFPIIILIKPAEAIEI